MVGPGGWLPLARNVTVELRVSNISPLGLIRKETNYKARDHARLRIQMQPVGETHHGGGSLTYQKIIRLGQIGLIPGRSFISFVTLA